MSTTLNMNHTVWTEIQGGRYHDAILDILCQCNPYCCFVFNHKWIKQNKSRKSSPVSFRCRGSCKFDDCPVQFCVEINKQDSSKQFEVLVTFKLSTKEVKGDLDMLLDKKGRTWKTY